MILPTSYKMKPPPSAKPIKSILKKLGCVGLWVMNENGGLTVYDLSGNRYDGTFENNPTWTSGKYGSAINFIRASTQRIKIGTVIPLIKTMVAYAYLTNTSSEQQIFSQKIGDYRQALMIDSGGGLGGAIYDNTAYQYTGKALVVGRHQIAMTSDGVSRLTQKVYIDGVLEAGGIGGIGLSSINGCFISASTAGTSDHIDGIIDCVLAYNRILSASEIAQLYQELFFMFDRPMDPLFSVAGVPPEIQALYMDLSTQIWTIKHAKGIFTKL